MRLSKVLSTSVGKKWLVGLTGLVWSGFVLTHMAGNMLILVSAEKYNTYGHMLVSNPGLPLAELFLVVTLIMHMGLALKLARENRVAKGMKPAMVPTKDQCDRATFASRTMVYSGLLIFVFLVLHLITFKYGPHYKVVYGGVEMRDLHKLIVEKFKDPTYVGFYIFCLCVLGLHLSHGIASVLQTTSLGSIRNGCIKKIAYTFAAIVALGFISQPVYILFGGAY